MAVVLHIGLEAIDAFRFLNEQFLPVMDTEGNRARKVHDPEHDSWEEWGEAYHGMSDDPEYPEDRAHHMMLMCPTITNALENIAWLREEGFTLVPMRWPRQDKVIAVVSRYDDWAETFLTVTHGPEWTI